MMVPLSRTVRPLIQFVLAGAVIALAVLWPEWRVELQTAGSYDLKITQVDVAQVVLNPDINNDTKVDLVSGKETVILSTIGATGFAATDARVVTINATLCNQIIATETRRLNQLSTQGTEVQLYFTPAIVGDCPLMATIDSANVIAEIDETNNTKSITVDVKPVRDVRYAYFAIDYLDEVPQFSQTVTDSGDYLKAVYPIDPTQFINQQISLPFIPAIAGLLPNIFGALDDALNLWLYGKLVTGFQAERIIGIVPKLWFTYHQLGNNTEGVVFPMVSEAAFVLDDRPLVTAHELGHTYGFGEGYVLNSDGTCCLSYGSPTSGFWVARKLKVPKSLDYMGASPGLIVYPAEGTMRWSTDINFADLFRQFRTQPADPDVLLVTGTIATSGTVSFRYMYRTPNGTISQPPTGGAAVRVLDINGNIVAETPFAVDFRVLTDPPTTTDTAPFALAVLYPANAVEIQIVLNNQVRAQVSITTQLLHDAVMSIPDTGFTKNPDDQRETLLNKIEALNQQLTAGAVTGAKNKLRNDIRKHLEDWLVDGYPTQTPLQYTKDAILTLVDELLQRLSS